LIGDWQIFNSYGFSWNEVLILTQSMIDALPFNNLIQFNGTKDIYALNDFGYKRRILNHEILNSYEFTASDIATINEVEYNSYSDSNLIRLAGDGNIYTITGGNKKFIGGIDIAQNLGYNLDSLHTVNKTDFNSYVTLP